MKESCGCCEGIGTRRRSTRNRPGLGALSYRLGTHRTFLEAMKARLTTMEIPPPELSSTTNGSRPLLALTTREGNDASIALLDAWALVGDVLTFYQERLANEGYLLTATERRSILELARLVGYRLRPGVAASVFLAYTLEPNYVVEIPLGAQVQSVPGPGELPQPFETSEKFLARAEWNTLKPRLTRPQIITWESDSATDAGVCETIYFEGVTTRLSANDPLLIIVGDDSNRQVRFIEAVDPQVDFDRTEVRLQNPIEPITKSNIEAILGVHIEEADNAFPGSAVVGQVVQVLKDLVAGAHSNLNLIDAYTLLQQSRQRVQELHELALKRKFTRLEPWIDEVMRLVDSLDVRDLRSDSTSTAPALTQDTRPPTQLSSFGNVFGLIESLSVAPSMQPASSQQLSRSTAGAFAAQSDLAPQLLTAFNPAAAETLYQAWANVKSETSAVEVDALRVKAGLFPGSFPGKSSVTRGDTITTSFDPPTLKNSWGELVKGSAGRGDVLPTAVLLDAVYDKIQPRSWVVIHRPLVDGNGEVTGPMVESHHRVVTAQTVTRVTEGYSNRVTQLKLNPDWMSTLSSGEDANGILVSSGLLHGTIVYAQSEPLPLAEEPLDRDICGGTIELDRLYAGLNSGRWVIVSGERTDIPNVTGVTAAELVMLAGVSQGPAKNNCVAFPLVGGKRVIPFSQVIRISDPDENNDRYVLGLLSEEGRELITIIARLPIPSAPNQQFCEPVELAPGFFVDAYVPTAFERLQVNSSPPALFGWRIKANNDAPHTTLLLANSLAYCYDAATVKIYGNVVKATHGGTKDEVLGSGDGSQELQEFTLSQSPLTYLAAPTPAGAASTAQVRVNDVLWHESDNLVGQGPKDRDYVLSTDENDQTSVVFGDGKYGARLPTGIENVKAVYRVGIGPTGNVKANQITSVVTKPLGVKEVINPLAASGGAGREDRDQARRNVPLAAIALDRLVSVQDYQDFARTYAGIAKASARRLSDGHRQLVHLTIAGNDDVPIAATSDLYINLRQALLQLGDPYQALRVTLRKVKLLVMSARVRLLPDYSWESVEPKLRAALLNKFGFAQRELAQDAFASEAQTVIQAQREVAYADLDIFDAISENTPAQGFANLGSTLRLRRRIGVNPARLDKQASGAILPAELAYLSPALVDTLILTEISG